MLQPKDREAYEIIIMEIENYNCSDYVKWSKRINHIAESPALEMTLKTSF